MTLLLPYHPPSLKTPCDTNMLPQSFPTILPWFIKLFPPDLFWTLWWKLRVVTLRWRKPSFHIIPQHSWTLGVVASLQDEPLPRTWVLSDPEQSWLVWTPLEEYRVWLLRRSVIKDIAACTLLSWAVHSGRRELSCLEDTPAAMRGGPCGKTEASHEQPALTRQQHETWARPPS